MFEEAEDLAFAIEVLDTQEDTDVAVTDAQGRAVSVVIPEPGWFAVAPVAQGNRAFSSARVVDGREVLLEQIGPDCTRAVVIEREPTRTLALFPCRGMPKASWRCLRISAR